MRKEYVIVSKGANTWEEIANQVAHQMNKLAELGFVQVGTPTIGDLALYVIMLRNTISHKLKAEIEDVVGPVVVGKLESGDLHIYADLKLKDNITKAEALLRRHKLTPIWMDQWK